MDKIEAAKLYAELTSVQHSCKAVEVKDGVVINHTDKNLIPVQHIEYQRPPRDGIYYATEATCGGGSKSGCSVGSPQKECIGTCYSPQKCAVYSLLEMTDETPVRTDIGTLRKLYERWWSMGDLGEYL